MALFMVNSYTIPAVVATALSITILKEPTREETVELFTNYLITSGNSADWAVASLWHSGILNSTEIRTVLAGAGFTDDEIDEAMAGSAAAQPATP